MEPRTEGVCWDWQGLSLPQHAHIITAGTSAALQAADTGAPATAAGLRSWFAAGREPDTISQAAPPPLHPDCIHGQPRPGRNCNALRAALLQATRLHVRLNYSNLHCVTDGVP
jgi:hypothetical protein